MTEKEPRNIKYEEWSDISIKKEDLLLKKSTEEWSGVDWLNWYRFMIKTETLKTDALKAIENEYEKMFSKLEFYFTIEIPKDEQHVFFTKPADFNPENISSGVSENFEEAKGPVTEILAVLKKIRLNLFDTIDSYELARKGIETLFDEKIMNPQKIKEIQGQVIDTTIQTKTIEETKKEPIKEHAIISKKADEAVTTIDFEKEEEIKEFDQRLLKKAFLKIKNLRKKIAESGKSLEETKKICKKIDRLENTLLKKNIDVEKAEKYMIELDKFKKIL